MSKICHFTMSFYGRPSGSFTIHDKGLTINYNMEVEDVAKMEALLYEIVRARHDGVINAVKTLEIPQLEAPEKIKVIEGEMKRSSRDLDDEIPF